MEEDFVGVDVSSSAGLFIPGLGLGMLICCIRSFGLEEDGTSL